MKRCNTCETWGTEPHPHNHIEEEVEGLLELIDLNRSDNTYTAENAKLRESIIYRYVWSPSDLFKIDSSQSIASVAHCLCINCIKYSLSFVPHYGDGAYCTANEHLKLEHPRVVHSHGIDIRDMNYRIVMRIRDTAKFKKISKTAGVIRSIPEGQELYVGGLVFSEKNTIKVIGFQEWNGHEWVDILLEDLKGVS
ncbi:hypothetical protein [Peribacillus sp. SCS-37]|uniref:hypothetical protein n=1 Tax=Paraperibacillus esterisolvens TaxID=3115296 RepID=UPI003906C817